MKHVIIGGSAAGVTAAETLRKSDKDAEITLISDETYPLYSRCLLTYLIAGALNESELNFKEKDFYKDKKIKTYLGKKATAIDVKNKTVSLEDKTRISYDKLLVATGATPKQIDVSGVDKKGVFTIRKIDDARAILAMLEKVKEVAVLGGGLIGLRDAYALALRKKKVTVVVKSPQVLSQMVDKEAADIIAALLEKNRIKIMTGAAAKEIVDKEKVEAVVLDNGQRLNCQLVIIGKGVRANTELAQSANLAVEEGIVVDEFLGTSNKDIFAAGDVAQSFDIARQGKRINALWPCAIEQGEYAALNMSGRQTRYPGSLSMNSVDFFGLACTSMGITKLRGEEKGYETILQTKDSIYKKFILKENRIVGAVFVGDIRVAGIVSVLIKKRIDISSIRDQLLEENFDYAKILPLVTKFGDKFKQEEFQDTIITY